MAELMSTKRMTEEQARAVIKDYENKERIRGLVAKRAAERGDSPASGPIFRPRTPPGGSPGSPLQSSKQYYDNARAALKYHAAQRAASLKRSAPTTTSPPPAGTRTPLPPARTRTPPPTGAGTPSPEEFRALLDSLGVGRPVKKAKGGLIKPRKKSSRKKSIDGIARKGKTKGTQR
jgi:hypothetical protein